MRCEAAFYQRRRGAVWIRIGLTPFQLNAFAPHVVGQVIVDLGVGQVAALLAWTGAVLIGLLT